MKVIFLDIDGVLNCSEFLCYKSKEIITICKEIDITKVRLLKEIIDRTGAVIVLSSSWRCGYPDQKDYVNMSNYLKENGVDIMDITPPSRSEEFGRGNEIRRWLQSHQDYNVTHFVILDDDNDMCEFTETNLVKTSWYGKYEVAALQPHHVEEAVKILGGK